MDDVVDRLAARIADHLAREPDVEMSDGLVEEAARIIGAEDPSWSAYSAVA